MNERVLETAQAVFQRHARTFSLAALLFEPERRAEVAVVYAFCRLVDDTADTDPDPVSANANLDKIVAELDGDEPRGLIKAFLQVCHAHDIDLEVPRELIKGVRSDLEQVRIEDDAGLLRYAYRVAGTVGLIMSPLIGVTDQAAFAHAIDLGIGMQITNICRDVLEDARNDRIYIPATRLREASITKASLLDGTCDRQALASVITDMLDMADRYYRSGATGMAAIPPRPRCAIGAASSMYRAIGVLLIENGADPLQGRTIVPLPTKIAWGLRGCVGALTTTGAHRHDQTLHVHLKGLPAVGG